TVIHNAGISIEQAVIATTMLQVGGIIGTLTLGRIIDRFSPYHVLAVAYFFAAVFIAWLGSAGASVGLIMALVFCAGFCVVGAQIGANALAATFYPTFIRSTGVGWALGIGRVGAVPALIAAVAAGGMGWAGRGLAAAQAPATTRRARG